MSNRIDYTLCVVSRDGGDVEFKTASKPELVDGFFTWSTPFGGVSYVAADTVESVSYWANPHVGEQE